MGARLASASFAFGLLAASQGTAVGAASAVPSPMCKSNAAAAGDPAATATARRVEDVLPLGGTVYVGGRFTSLLPPGGGAEVARGRLGACSLASGAIQPWNPGADAPVFALAGDSRAIFVGGLFKAVGGASRSGLAALNPTTGAALGWKPSVGGGAVKTMALSGNTLYVGGTFKSVNGTPRNRLAALDVTTGALKGWDPGKRFDPTATYDVRALVVSGSRVIVGEYFTNAMPNIMAVDAASGGQLPWTTVPTRPVLDLSVYGSRLYAAAAGSGGRLYAFDVATGTRKWQLSTDGNIQAVWATSDAVYAGGHFAAVRNANGSTTPRARLLATSPSGALLGWNPGVDQSGQGIYVLRGGASLVAGGEFRFIAGQARQGLVRFGL
jgi:outer membrane protein assembly factor BamB